MDTIEINGTNYEVSGYAEDGLPIIKARVESRERGFDKDGNPIRDVNVMVPVADFGLISGNNG